MGKAIDMTGIKYNKLLTIKKCDERDNGHLVWLFKCDCGKVVQARGGDVRQGKIMSCGCYNIETSKKLNAGYSNEERKRMRIERESKDKVKR